MSDSPDPGAHPDRSDSPEETRYADDLRVLHDEPRLGESDLPFDVEGASILLVDDVI